AGHVSTTTPIAVTLVADTTPPSVTSVSITNGSVQSQALQNITIGFSKALDPNTVNASTFSIVGPDGKPLPGVSATLAKDGRSVLVSFNATGKLAVGTYQLQIDNADVQGLVGNALGTGTSTTNFNVRAFSDVWISPVSGDWNNAANWSA